MMIEGYLMITYNVKTGQNTVLRGVIAEEFVRYTLTQRMPIIILRPRFILEKLASFSIKGKKIDFLRKYQQTMDFFGIGPIIRDDKLQFSIEQIIYNFFFNKRNLDQYLSGVQQIQTLKGFIIEVKSRTTANPRDFFEFSFSPNQEMMLTQLIDDFDVILCGVTFTENWNLSVVFCDRNQKILPSDYFSIDL